MLKKDNEQVSGNNGTSSKNLDRYLNNLDMRMAKFEKNWAGMWKLVPLLSPASSLSATQSGFNKGNINTKPFSPMIDVNTGGVKDDNPLSRGIYNTTNEIGYYKNYAEGTAIFLESIEPLIKRPLSGGLPASPGRIGPISQGIFNWSKLFNKFLGTANPVIAGISFGTAPTPEEKKAVLVSAGGAVIGGGIGQALIPVPVVGYLIGSFIGGFGAGYAFENFDSIMEAFEGSMEMNGKGNLRTAESYIAFNRAVNDCVSEAVADSMEMSGKANLRAAEINMASYGVINDVVSEAFVNSMDMLGKVNLFAATKANFKLANSIGESTAEAIQDFFGWGGSNKDEGLPTSNDLIPTPHMKVPPNKEITFQEFMSMTSPQRSPFNLTGVRPDLLFPATEDQSPINVTLSPGTVQLSISSSEPDYDELSSIIGIGITKAVQQALANSSGGRIR